MPPSFYEIAHNHRHATPLTEAQNLTLGQLCDINPSARVLDLGCGNGELLCQWALHYRVVGVGVEGSDALMQTARARGFDLAVWDKITWAYEEPQTYPNDFHQFDVVCNLGGRVGLDFADSFALMRSALRDGGGLLVFGEPFWQALPPPALLSEFDLAEDTFPTLDQLHQRFEQGGAEVRHTVLATHEGRDAYERAQWKAVDQWLQNHRGDPAADDLRAWSQRNQHNYQAFEQHYVGWGAFVLAVYL
jgi:SAM-dependent methyltransferase